MSSPAATTMPPPVVDPNDLGYGPVIMGVTWTFTIIAVVAVALRLYLRAKVVRCIGPEDWLMFAAAMLQVANECINTVSYHYGLGKHDASLTGDQLVDVLKWNWIASPTGQMVSVLARISICILLVRLFGVHRWLKWFLIIFTTVQSVFGILVLIFIWVQVTPVEALWDVTLPSSARLGPNALLNVEYLAQSLYTFSDLTYALFPVVIIWRLNMSLRQRIGLCLLMAVSIFTMITSILKIIRFDTVATTSLDTVDAEYNASLTVMWTGLEQANVIIMGCVPALRAITKLDLPILRFLGASLSNLFSGGNRSARSRTLGRSDKSSSGAYQDLELNSRGMDPTSIERDP